jgi:hypothetical protein
VPSKLARDARYRRRRRERRRRAFAQLAERLDVGDYWKRRDLRAVVAQELSAGRIRLASGGERFELVVERFEPDVLAALRDLHPDVEPDHSRPAGPREQRRVEPVRAALIPSVTRQPPAAASRWRRSCRRGRASCAPGSEALTERQKILW